MNIINEELNLGEFDDDHNNDEENNEDQDSILMPF